MNYLYYLPYAAIMIAYDWLEWIGSAKSRLIKPFLMPMLVIGLAASTAGGYSRLIALGLIFGFIGDVALMMPSHGARQLPLLVGIGAFLLGHVMYGVWCIRALPRFNAAGLLYVPVLIVIGYALFRHLSPGVGDMRIPVLAYEAVILSMSLCAFLLLTAKPNAGSIIFWLGSVLFILSDSTLAEQLFLHGRAHSGFIVSVTYTAAQLLIALGSSLF